MNRFQHREAIEDYLNPLNGYRGKLQAQGKEVKNHIKANRAALRKTQDAFEKKQEVKSIVNPADQFKMKKFQNVQSKIRQEQMNEDTRPVVESDIKARRNSARGVMRQESDGQIPKKIVFGRSYSNINRNGANEQPKQNKGPSGSLNKGALDKLNNQSKPGLPPRQSKAQQENVNAINMEKKPEQPPKTPNYGKTPEYIHKFKEEAKLKEDERLEAKAAKTRPPGTRVIDEKERVETLEHLE